MAKISVPHRLLVYSSMSISLIIIWSCMYCPLITKASFVASLQILNFSRQWSDTQSSGYLKHALFSSEIYMAVVKSLEIIGHVTNCCKKSILSVDSNHCTKVINVNTTLGFRRVGGLWESPSTSPPWTNELGQPFPTRIFRLTAPEWKMISPVLFAWNFLMTFKVGIENIEANIEASWKVDIVTSYTPQQQGHFTNHSAGNENVAKQRV